MLLVVLIALGITEMSVRHFFVSFSFHAYQLFEMMNAKCYARRAFYIFISEVCLSSSTLLKWEDFRKASYNYTIYNCVFFLQTTKMPRIPI